MDIWIPKYTTTYVEGIPALRSGIRGEYRVRLRGPDGRIKYETDWLPNMVLDLGLYHMSSAGNQSPFRSGFVGSSATPSVETMVGIQGPTAYATTSQITGARTNNGIGDGYSRSSIMTYVWGTGTATDTLNEFVISGGGIFPNGLTGGNIRVVLAAPVIKGIYDQLSIDHKLTYYPPLARVTGVLDISGVDYNYEYGLCSITAPSVGHSGIITYNKEANVAYWGLINAPPTLTQAPQDPGGWVGNGISGVLNYGGSLATNWWAEVAYKANIDAADNTANYFYSYFNMGGNVYNYFTKVSDGSPLIKTDTHEFIMTLRHEVVRYVP